MTPVTFIFPADKSTDLTNSRDTAARELSEAALPAPETVSNDGALCKLLIFEQCRRALLLTSAERRCFSNEHLSFSLTELQTSHVPTGHEMVGQPVHSVCRGNGCLVFSRLLRTQSIYITYNTFHTRRASSATRTKKNPNNSLPHNTLQVYRQPRPNSFIHSCHRRAATSQVMRGNSLH